MGSRRHIFTTFAIFMLVQVYGISVRETALLFLVNSLISAFVLPQLGKLVARFGERKVLTFNFAGLIFVFLGYAYIPYLPLLYGLFVLDHIFFGFNLASSPTFKRSPSRRKRSPAMSAWPRPLTTFRLWWCRFWAAFCGSRLPLPPRSWRGWSSPSSLWCWCSSSAPRPYKAAVSSALKTCHRQAGSMSTGT